MKLIKKLKSLFLLLFFFTANKVIANRHYIFAFDVAYADRGCINFIADVKMRSIVKAILSNNGFSEEDYISFVSYSIDIDNPNFAKFVTIAKDVKGKSLKWAQYKDANDAMNHLSKNWYDITVGHQLHHGRIASMQSLAKQYILRAVGSRNKAADETWLLMITDDLVNGVGHSYANEYTTVASAGNFKAFEKFKKDVFSFMGDFNKKIQFEIIPIKNVGGNSTINLGLGYRNLRIIAYNAHPTVLPSIQSITDIPSSLPIKRVRGGFDLTLNVNLLSNEFSVNSVIVKIKENEFLAPLNNSVFINKEMLSDGDSITLTMNMKYIDGVYNGMLISPLKDIYRQGMTLKTKYKMQEDTKIFGLLPLVDSFWWFFPNDVTYAVLTWDVIIILIFIAVVCFTAYKLFRKFTLYRPKNEDIYLDKL